MGVFKKIWSYLTYSKSNDTDNSYLKMMHGINKISIFVFLAGMIFLIVKCLK
jgi:hypothetical protein